MARLLAAAGAKVVVSSRKQEAVDEVAGAIRAAGGEATGRGGPRGRHGAGETAGRKTLQLYGGADILINNAATNPVFGPVVECDEGAFDKIMA
jgi:NAD(P)-dependent dehydrogenase (short-subunit alcohol dehydrogenase family)